MGGSSIEDSICSRYPNAKQEDLEHWSEMLSDKTLQGGQDYRSVIDTLLQEMNKGNGFGENGKPCKHAKAPKALKGVDLILQVHLWNLSTVSWQKRFTVETTYD